MANKAAELWVAGRPFGTTFTMMEVGGVFSEEETADGAFEVTGAIGGGRVNSQERFEECPDCWAAARTLKGFELLTVKYCVYTLNGETMATSASSIEVEYIRRCLSDVFPFTHLQEEGQYVLANPQYEGKPSSIWGGRIPNRDNPQHEAQPEAEAQAASGQKRGEQRSSSPLTEGVQVDWTQRFDPCKYESEGHIIVALRRLEAGIRSILDPVRPFPASPYMNKKLSLRLFYERVGVEMDELLGTSCMVDYPDATSASSSSPGHVPDRPSFRHKMQSSTEPDCRG